MHADTLKEENYMEQSEKKDIIYHNLPQKKKELLFLYCKHDPADLVFSLQEVPSIVRKGQCNMVGNDHW